MSLLGTAEYPWKYSWSTNENKMKKLGHQDFYAENLSKLRKNHGPIGAKQYHYTEIILCTRVSQSPRD